MEIGTEISRKIRTAIKGKLQELGAYVDEELPDYIMVMVANKKSHKQMTDDLSLFLGNNTARFTTWLQGVLDKLRAVTPESNSLKASEAIIFNSAMPPLKSLPPAREDSGREAGAAMAHERAQGVRSYEATGPAGRLTSAVKPLRELSPSEAVIDIKLDTDDPFSDDLPVGPENPPYARARPQRPPAQLYRPPGASRGPGGAEKARQMVAGRALARMYRAQEEMYKAAMAAQGPRESDSSRKRKIPVASSVVKVKRGAEEEEEEEDYLSAGLSSSVSVASKPERRPTLPPSKQANKNLILKAISEAQESINRTTSYSAEAPAKQTVPVAPRTRRLQEEEEQLILMKSRASMFHYQEEPAAPAPDTRHAPEDPAPWPAGMVREEPKVDVLSRLQSDPPDERALWRDDPGRKPLDSRSFILKRPKDPKDPPVPVTPAPSTPQPGRLIQPRESAASEKPGSPKFIVTLDGVPSPPGYLSDHEDEPMIYTEQGEMDEEAHGGPRGEEPRFPQLNDTEMSDLTVSPAKSHIPERCKYWPACKNATNCAYHHPSTPCKAFPRCRFADKCFFIHPNCKFDAKCTKADCPYTHASRRAPAMPQKTAPAPRNSASQTCRYFPSCRNTECPFLHPKPCRFNTKCTRSDCEFYHPVTAVPPRHALTWRRTQASE